MLQYPVGKGISFGLTKSRDLYYPKRRPA